MSTTDRNADGYEPRFDVDYEYGHQGEMWVTNVVDALKKDRVEVKRDGKFHQTGNLYVEYECWRRGGWRQSGIATTTAELWVFVLGSSETAIVIPTQLLKNVCRDLWRRDPRPVAEEKDGSHPTRGVLVKLSYLMAVIQKNGNGWETKP